MHDHDGTSGALPRLPALAPWFGCEFDGAQVRFRNGDTVVVMEGAAVSRLVAPVVSLLDGRHSLDQIAESAGLQLEAVGRVVAMLDKAGLVTDGVDLPAEEALLHSASVAASRWPHYVTLGEAADRIREARVMVAGCDTVSRLIAEQLTRLAIKCSIVEDPGHQDGSLPRNAIGCDLLIIGPSLVHELARSANKQLYEAGVSWLPVFPFNGHYSEVGPLIVPPDSGCYECFVLRRKANVTYGENVYDALERSGVRSPLEYAPLDFAAAATAAFVAHEWVAVRHPDLPGISYCERAGTWEREAHHLLRVPRCPVCATRSQQGIPAAWWATP